MLLSWLPSVSLLATQHSGCLAQMVPGFYWELWEAVPHTWQILEGRVKA